MLDAESAMDAGEKKAQREMAKQQPKAGARGQGTRGGKWEEGRSDCRAASRADRCKNEAAKNGCDGGAVAARPKKAAESFSESY